MKHGKLKATQAPTVVVHGSEDPLMSFEGAKDTATNIPGAELRVRHGESHLGGLGIAADVLDTLLDWPAR